ncbi:sulfotransferase family protein [Streptomyces sp. HUAS TT20]|uniref:sulfotransferase family protein n=1 Tax=Streptomyces sp. HUAS TT20 TaxID=3447509 RepID=UPI0021D7D52F|nr:sulfotransferase family protein [Streptomyces sp. HUAS 15-9]UXY31784.1 sulfotransferase family protein [Streptomyces sp. HUAS 15-9]
MLEIFGVGFGRTGTLSLKKALERLGFGPCHHMLGLFEDPDTVALWQAAARGEPVDWTRVYQGYRSGVDWPGAAFWRQITAAFPEAKVILTERDPDAWYASAESSIHAAAVAPLPDDADPLFARVRQMSLDVVWDGVFGGRFTDRQHALDVYEGHIAAVKRELDPARLLVFEVGQGWEPLCAFLGVPAPDEPFPRSNDRAAFTAQLARLRAAGSTAEPAG